MDSWDSYEKKWKKIKDIEFIWHGDYEIVSQLMNQELHNKGIIKYWFNKDALTKEWFKIHLQQTIKKAEPRYSRNLNIETGTKNYLLGIVKDDAALRQNKNLLDDLESNYKNIKISLNLKKIPKEWQLIEKIDCKVSEIKNYLNDELYINNKNDLSKSIQEAIYSISYDEKYKNIIKKPDKYRDTNSYNNSIRSFQNNLYKLDRFIEETNSKTYLLLGKAGEGKTHLLCDVLTDSLKDNYVCLLVLGNYLKNQSLEKGIIDNLEIFSDITEFLGSLNSYAKSKKQIALLVIDGINEWEECKKDQILPEIELLRSKVDKYENIKLLISCRSEYKDDIFKRSTQDYHIFWHEGFLDDSINALYSFCKHYKIKVPSTPLLSPELSNPLILKTICEAFEGGEFPKGMQGLQKIFNSYIEHLNRKISNQLDLDPDDEKVQKIIEKITNLIYKNDGKINISKDKIKSEIKSLETGSKWSKSILLNLEKEGFLVLTKDYCYPSYDKYRDYLVSNCILNDTKILQSNHLKTALVKKIDSLQSKVSYNGIINCLAVAIPEKFDFDLIDLYRGKKLSNDFIAGIINSFYRSIAQRSQCSISENTIKDFEYLKTIVGGEFEDEYWKSLINCSPVEGHPLNAEYLHNILIKLTMPDRDASWTRFISVSYDDDHGDSESYFNLKSLINPFSNVDNNTLSDETIELISTLLIWITSSTNRFLRQEAVIASSW